MDDMRDNGARGEGKHNLNFEDHNVFFCICMSAMIIYSTVMV